MISNYVLPIGTMVFSCFFLIFSLALPRANEGIGPGGWPTAVLSLMFILGGALLIRVHKDEKKKSEAAELPSSCGSDKTEKQDVSTENCRPHRHWVVAGVIFLYFFTMQYLGMMIVTPIFIIVMALVLGMRNWIAILMTALLSTAVFIALFANVLSLSLPRGMGIFRSFSSIFY